MNEFWLTFKDVMFSWLVCVFLSLIVAIFIPYFWINIVIVIGIAFWCGYNSDRITQIVDQLIQFFLRQK